ncbi:MAG: hypothetical protein AABX04_05800 [Nanoarchaeota archaeon]
MQKKVVITFVLVFLVLVGIVSAANETSCTGFWGKIGCFIFGDATKRAAVGGKAWWDGSSGNVVIGW